MQTATLDHLKAAVRHRDDAPGHMLMHDIDQVVGVCAKTLGLQALGRGLAVDLGNGYVLVCTTEMRNASNSKASAEVPA